MKTVRSVCPYCGVGCGVVIEVARGRIAGVRGDPDHPTNRGGLCAKGRALAETVRPGDRLLRPMARATSGRPFREVSWKEAIGRVAGVLAETRRAHGPEAIALYLSGQLQTEDYYVANKLGKGLLGTPNVDTNSRLCMASTAVAYKRAFGVDGPPGCYEDLDLARDVLVMGSNMADTHPILFGRLRAARQRSGAHWTVVDPRRTATAAQADEHLAVRPGSDVALLLGMAQALFEEGLVDEPAVARACAGLDEMRAAAGAMPPERAADVCGVPATRIRAAARRMARSPAALSVWCQGLNQSATGTDRVNAVIDLHLLTSQIGRPGTGPLSLTGQANAMGGREVGALATELACHRGWDDPLGRAEVEAHWGLGALPAGRGLTAVELIQAIEERRVRVLWVACTNPAASLPDGAAARAALAKLDLLVVQDLYHPTDTGELAHVLLPAAGWGEKTGTLTSSERRVALARRAVDPPGEARPDWQIFADVGAALGAPRAFGWRSPAEVFEEHVRLGRGRDLDMTGVSHALLEREGPQQWPYPAGGRPAARRYGDGRCHTPDGRPRLVPVAWTPPAEQPSAAYPLRLLTGRDRDRWHTLTRTGRVAALRDDGEGGTPPLYLHPDDAGAVGVEAGATVRVSSSRGTAQAVLRLDDGLPRGSTFLPFHAGPLLQPEGWANALPGRALDPHSLQPELKHTAVRVEPARGMIALAGGALAEAVADRLEAAGTLVRRMAVEDLARTPAGVRRVVICGETDGALPWWRAVEEPPSAAQGGAGGADALLQKKGVALLDLAGGPEPLTALPALREAGWSVAVRGDLCLPPAVARLVAPSLATDGEPRLRVGGAVAGPVPGELGPAPAGTLTLAPGGRLGLHGPLSGDPERLAGFLSGGCGVRAAQRRLLAALSRDRWLVLAGDPVGEPVGAAPPGVDLLVHEDRVEGSAQVWRLASGQVLGVAAVLSPRLIEDVERLWLADPTPELVRRRFPVR